MQLKKAKSVREALATATCGLLGGAVHQAQAADDPNAWQVDSALLYYDEKDRIKVFEPVVSASKEINDDEFVRIRLVLDSLTGSSPNGAMPMPFAQTFTSPSSNSTYTTDANKTPLDPNFEDLRVALNLEWETPLNRTLKGIFGGNVSVESDYTSIGASATLAKDFNNRTTTLTAGLAASYDYINPEGGVPTALTGMPTYPETKDTRDSADDKLVADAIVGLTQVLSRKTLFQLNFSSGINDGYLSDPYKLLSVVDSNGNLVSNDENAGRYSYRYENRPDSRYTHSVYGKLTQHLNEDVVYLSYRYFWDDWGIDSHTVDLRYRWELGGGHYIQPHYRYYTQSQADFYKPYLIDGEIPKEASADYRLGELTTNTYGLLYGISYRDNQEFTARVEYMKQSGDEPYKFGTLQDQELFPDVKAYILQIGYTFKFD